MNASLRSARPVRRRTPLAWQALAAGSLLATALSPSLARAQEGVKIDPTPRVQVYFDDVGRGDFGQPLSGSMRFGVVATDPKQPGSKKLTYDRHGGTNSTVVRIDGADRALGFPGDGVWVSKSAPAGGKWKGTKSVWMGNGKVQVTQIVEVVPGTPVETKDGPRRLLDTALVRYQIENKDTRGHKVGLRFMLDTLIGENDGVPFTVPGLKGLVDTMYDFTTPDKVPPFLQVLERGDADLRKAGLVAFLTLKVGGKVEAPGRVSLTRWPGVSRMWNVPMVPMGDDSAVVMYWNEQELKPGEKREVGFSYGLYRLATRSGQLALTVGGNFNVGGEVTVVALVSRAQRGQKLTLKLPEGFALAKGQEATQPVVPGLERPAPVTWRIVSSRPGRFELEVESSTGGSQAASVTILTTGLAPPPR